MPTEAYFPPIIFDISVHLIVHLVKEIRYLGPMFLHHMYPYERFMSILNRYMPRVRSILREAWHSAILLRRWLTGASVTWTPPIQLASPTLAMREG